MPCLRGVRPNSAAYVFGQYCNLEIAVRTFDLVVHDTYPASFTTRDTVAVETPASPATSLIVLGLRLAAEGEFLFPTSAPGETMLESRRRCISSLEVIKFSPSLLAKLKRRILFPGSNTLCTDSQSYGPVALFTVALFASPLAEPFQLAFLTATIRLAISSLFSFSPSPAYAFARRK